VCVCVCVRAFAIGLYTKLQMIFNSLKQKLFESTDTNKMNRKFLPPNRDIGPLFVHRNSWQLMKCGGRSKFCRTGNFCPQTSHGAISGIDCI